MNPLSLAIVALLIAANALYVAAEFSVVSSRRSRIRELSEHGNRLATLLMPVMEDRRILDRYVAGCQIGITLSSLILGAYGQVAFTGDLAGTVERAGVAPAGATGIAALVVLVGLTALQVIFGELVPKSISLQYPTRIALYTALPMRWSLWLYRPLIAALNGSGIAVLKLLRANEVTPRHIHSAEEIKLLLVESREGGALARDEQERLKQAIELSTEPLRRFMVPRPHIRGLDARTPPDQLVAAVAASPYTRMPVFDGSVDNVVGMIHARDVLERRVTGGPLEMGSIMRPAVSIPESAHADDLLTLLRRERAQQAMVIDEYGGVAGLISIEDIARNLLGPLTSEFRAGQPPPERLADGRVRLPGLMPLEDVTDWTGVPWQGHADTVSGHVTDALGRLPREGERLVIDNVEVEVEGVAHRAVTSILVRVPEREAETG